MGKLVKVFILIQGFMDVISPARYLSHFLLLPRLQNSVLFWTLFLGQTYNSHLRVRYQLQSAHDALLQSIRDALRSQCGRWSPADLLGGALLCAPL